MKLPIFLALLLVAGSGLRAQDLQAEFASLDTLAVEYIADAAPEAEHDPWASAPAAVFFRAQFMRLGDPNLRIPYYNTVFSERYKALQQATETEGLTPGLRQAWHAWFTDWRAVIRNP